jgi:hypothetical protein
MKRLDFYFEQLVGESDMDQLQSNAEEAMQRIMTDQAYFGVTTGYSVVQHAPVPNLTVDIGGPGIGYDQLGRRVAMSSSVTLNMSTDSNGLPTTVVSSGNEKWVSIFVQFTRVQTDQRFDGNGLPVLYVNDEGYQFIVTQGAEATAGLATRPALRSDALLIGDVKLSFGTTQILNAMIESADVISKPNSRFQYIFNLAASSPAMVRTGRLPTAMQFTLDQLNAHIAGTTGVHPGTAIDNDIVPDSMAWTNLLAGANMSEAIGGLTTDVRESGADIIETQEVTITGISPLLPLNSFFDGGTVQQAFDEIVQKFVTKEQIDESVAPIYQTTTSGAAYRPLFRRPTTSNQGIRIYTHDDYGWCFTINQFWNTTTSKWNMTDTAGGKENFRFGNLKHSIDGGNTNQGSIFAMIAQESAASEYFDDDAFSSGLTGGFIFSIRSPYSNGNLIRLGTGSTSSDPVGFNFDVTPSGQPSRRYDCAVAGGDLDSGSSSNYAIPVIFPGNFGSTPTTFTFTADATSNISSVALIAANTKGAVIGATRAGVGTSYYVGRVVVTP